jgi:hypothetical protein
MGKRVLIAVLLAFVLLTVLVFAGVATLWWLAPFSWQESVHITIDGHRWSLPDWHWGHGLGGAAGVALALLIVLVVVPIALLLGVLGAALGIVLGLLGLLLGLAVVLSPLLVVGLLVWLVMRDRRTPPTQVPPAPPPGA